MKNVVKKNQIIITALAIMIVVAGYLNFTGQEISTSGLVSSQKNENVIADATATPKETAKMKKGQQKTQDSAYDGTSENYTGMLGMHGTKTSNLGVSAFKMDSFVIISRAQIFLRNICITAIPACFASLIRSE